MRGQQGSPPGAVAGEAIVCRRHSRGRYSGVSRKSGRRKRLSLYDRGKTACPICLTGFTP